MSAHVLLNLSNELEKRDEIWGACRAFYRLSKTRLISLIIQELEC